MSKGRHLDRSVILLCVRWYLAYRLSLRDPEEMMAKLSISFDHTTTPGWTVHGAALLLERFNRRKCSVYGLWHVFETYVKALGRWVYLYRSIANNGAEVEFWFSERSNLTVTKQCLNHAPKPHGRRESIMIDGIQTSREAILACDTTGRLEDRS